MNNQPRALTIRVDSAKETSPGRKRTNNEDFSLIFEPNSPDELEYSGCLYIVADGVGGARKGEKASQYAAEKVSYDYFAQPEVLPEERLRNILHDVGNEIYNFAEGNAMGRMATTLVASVIRGDRLTVANVGDSRAYLIRNSQVSQITHDHNQLEELLRSGALTPEEAQGSKVGNVLTRSVGGHPDVEADIFADIPLYPGDLLLLCSDGLHRYLKDDATLLALTNGVSPAEISKRLVEHANQAGGADNITALVVAIRQAEQTGITKSVTQPLHRPDALDALDTEPGRGFGASRELSGASAAVRQNTKTNPYILLWAAGFLMFALLVLAAAFFFFIGPQIGVNLLGGRDNNLPTLASTISGILVTKTTVASTPSPLPALPTASQQAQTGPEGAGASQQPAASTLQSPDAAAPSPTAPVTQVPAANLGCVYWVRVNDTLIGVLDRFGLKHQTDGSYFYYPACQDDRCAGKRAIGPEAIIVPGWQVVIPGVSQETCTSEVAGGKWMILEP